MCELLQCIREIKGDTFAVIAKKDSEVHIFKYVSGIFSEVDVIFTEKTDTLKETVVPAGEIGYYFVVAGRAMSVHRKGDVQKRFFLYDGKKRSDLQLSPSSYDINMSKLGDNEFSHIGSGIYEIVPVNLSPCILEIFDTIYYVNPMPESYDSEQCAATGTTLSASSGEAKIGVITGKAKKISAGTHHTKIRARNRTFTIGGD